MNRFGTATHHGLQRIRHDQPVAAQPEQLRASADQANSLLSEAVFGYRLSFPLPPPDMPPPNSDDSGELGVAAGAGAGAAITGRAIGFGFAGRGVATFLDTFLAAFFFGAAFLAAFLAVFFLAAFFFGAALRRADFFAALRATFLRVILDLVLTRAFLDFAAFFFARFFDAFFAAIVFTPPVGPVCLRTNPIPRSRELKTLVRDSAS
jgi:hypothetical protein